MNVNCPKCQSTKLQAAVHISAFYSIESIGLADIIPKDIVDHITECNVFCPDCSWVGSVEDYWALKDNLDPNKVSFIRSKQNEVDPNSREGRNA